MQKSGDVYVPVTCDCGHKFKVSLVGHDPETMEFTCPSCGNIDRFTPEQAAKILTEYEAAKAGAAKAVADAVNKINRRR